MQIPTSRTIPDLLDEMASRYPGHEALVGSGQRCTYAAFRERVRSIAKGLHALGVRSGDKVGILMGNRPEWILTDFAVTTLGAVMVSVNTWVTVRELEYLLRHSDISLLVTAERFLKYDYLSMLAEIAPAAERLPLLRRIVCLSDRPQPGTIPFETLERLGADVPDDAIDRAAAAVRGEDVAYILYTSGSTSTPKGVQLQHFALIENMWHIGERQHLTEHDRLWLAVSLFWGLGCENALFAVMTHGGCVVLQEHFEPGEALRIIEAERCTVWYGTPNMGQAMFEHPDRPGRDLSSLRTGATIGTPEQIQRVVELGAHEICNIYGLTETYGNCAVTDAHEPPEVRLASVGTALPGVDMQIADPETHAPLPPGQVGEIKVRGYVTCGYYKDPARTATAFDADGYFLTGDLGMLDGSGHLYFRGRIKEMIKTGGINVAPIEVEEVLMSDPRVELAFVVGIPDPLRDEVIAAVVVPRTPGAVSVEELRDLCRRSLASYKVPRHFRLVTTADLPLTTTGKLQKSRLVELFQHPSQRRGSASV